MGISLDRDIKLPEVCVCVCVGVKQEGKGRCGVVEGGRERGGGEEELLTIMALLVGVP